MNVEEMLSEEFVTFSQKIAAILAKKNELKMEYAKNVRALHEEAKEAQGLFEQWKTSQSKTSSSSSA